MKKFNNKNFALLLTSHKKGGSLIVSYSSTIMVSYFNSLCYLKYDCLSTQNCPDYPYIIESTFLEDEMFYLSNITLFSKYTVECHAQVVPQNFIL